LNIKIALNICVNFTQKRAVLADRRANRIYKRTHLITFSPLHVLQTYILPVALHILIRGFFLINTGVFSQISLVQPAFSV